MTDIWGSLSPMTQDAFILASLCLPGLLLGILVLRGYRPWGLVRALLWRHRGTNLLFIALMGLSVGLGTALIAQERGIRAGLAQAADKFDLIVAAPGSRIDMLLATVYLQPVDAPLLDGHLLAELSAEPQVALAAPIAYGDSYRGHPVIGSTAAFVAHLTDGLVEGRLFETTTEAIAGARVPLEIGRSFTPAHGHGPASGDDDHHDTRLEIVGRMPMTGSPWDRAIIVAVESVWEVHGLGRGHPPEQSGRLGPPYDPGYFPGTPAILVRAEALWANYALASKYTRPDTMAFFPGTVLAELFSHVGNVRQAMSMMATLSQVLVAAGVLAGLVVLARLFARRFALLRALGAPRRFVFAVMWGYTATLILAGAALGLLCGYLAASVISQVITRRTDILVAASLGWPELHLVVAFLSLTLWLALLPAASAYGRPVVANLRTH